jgi:hypothetical protein
MQDAHWWLVLLPLLLGQAAMFGLWVWGGWSLGRLAGGVGGAPWAGAGLGAAAWWLVGTALDWLGYRVSYRMTRGHWEFQPLAGALAGWALPVIILGIPALLGALCWGVAALVVSLF